MVRLDRDLSPHWFCPRIYSSPKGEAKPLEMTWFFLPYLNIRYRFFCFCIQMSWGKVGRYKGEWRWSFWTVRDICETGNVPKIILSPSDSVLGKLLALGYLWIVLSSTLETSSSSPCPLSFLIPSSFSSTHFPLSLSLNPFTCSALS